MKFGNMKLFLAWCRRSISCDECGSLGAVCMRDKTFVCTECARNLYRPA